MIFKGMVVFVSTSWIQPCPSCRLILPETKIPKNKSKTLAMAFHDTEHINQIGYYKQFANDVRVKNMQLFHSMDARIVIFDFKNMADSWTTYSALGGLKTRGLDWVSFWRWPAND